MLYQAVLYLVITTLCLWTGLIFYSIFRYINKTSYASFHRPSLISHLLSGLMLIALFGQWLVLFFPLNITTLLAGIIPILLILTLLTRRTLTTMFRQLITSQPKHPFFLPCLVVFVVMILVLNAGPTIMDDTDSYHIQIIKWTQEYGTVPGIANLHIRFGINSSWFHSIALLTPGINGINHYLTLNGLLSCWLCYYFLEKALIPHPDKTNISVAVAILLLTCLILWSMIRGNAATANYDFISSCCIIVLVIEAGLASDPAHMPEWIIWPLFLCTVKLINFALLLLGLLSLIRYFSKRTLLTYIAAAAFILIPFGIRNLLLSGYPLFPLPQFDLFAFDWKVSRSLVAEWMDYTKYFNRSNGNPELVSHLPFPGWVRIWQTHLFPYDKVLADFSLLCWLLILLRWRKLTILFSAPYKLLVLVLLFMLTAWFVTAPDPRFIYGALLAGIFIFIMTLPPLITPGRRHFLNIAVITLSVSIFIYTAIKVITNPHYRNWVLPYALPVPATRRLIVDGIEMRIPEKVLDNWNPRCFDLQLPCLYVPNPHLHARGKDIRDGFRLEGTRQEQQMTGEFKIR
ncbi:MAG: hypothetical protein J0H74_17400 [Chitinophagaceae bacterium]|nr:hypothetical protein [Chitinophagaceae bacterium]